MALLALQPVTPSGLAPSFAAASAGGDTVPPGDTHKLHVKNGGGSSINVTVNSQRSCNQGADHDLVVAVPAGGERYIGPLPADRFANAAGLVEVTYSGVSSVTVAAIAG